jgi:Cu(I)/Ag(I) efflux system membrane protein CusA/SilA
MEALYASNALASSPIAIMMVSAILWLARLGSGLGSEFIPDLFEGDLMYMPTT